MHQSRIGNCNNTQLVNIFVTSFKGSFDQCLAMFDIVELQQCLSLEN
jgi:hypothetical protein